jgi:hypothetical protein
MIDGASLRNPFFSLREAIDYLFSTYEFHNEFAADIDNHPEP